VGHGRVGEGYLREVSGPDGWCVWSMRLGCVPKRGCMIVVECSGEMAVHQRTCIQCSPVFSEASALYIKEKNEPTKARYQIY
jgi:hypothetical protein